MGIFGEVAGAAAGAAWLGARRAAGADHRESCKQAAQVIAQIFMTQRNMLPRDAEAKAQALVAAGREQAKAAGTDTIDMLGERTLRTQEAYCRALIDIEHVHVSEIREWWDEPGFMRCVYVMLGHEEWARAKDLFASMGADEATANACAWRAAPIFGQHSPVPGQDPNYTPLAAELWYRVRQTSLEPPWMSNFDPMAMVSSVATGERTPTYNAWLRGQLAFGRVPVPKFQQ